MICLGQRTIRRAQQIDSETAWLVILFWFRIRHGEYGIKMRRIVF